MQATSKEVKLQEPAASPQVMRRSYAELLPKLLRRLVSGAILAAGLVLVYRNFFMVLSSEAVVSAEFFTVAAPIDGYLDHDLLDPGKVVAPAAVVGHVENPRVDKQRLFELTGRIAALDGQIAALRATLDSYAELGKTFSRRGAAFTKRRSEQLSVLAAQLEAKLKADRAKLDETSTRLERFDALASSGVATDQQREEATRDHAIATQALIATQHELESLRMTLDAARAGLTLGEFSGADRVYSGQRADEVQLRTAQIDGDLQQLVAERAALAAERDSEQRYVDKLQSAELDVPKRARLWEIKAAPNEYVRSGQPVFRFVDCSRLHIVAYLNERNYNQVQVGDEVTISPERSNETFAGKVALLLGSAEVRLSPGGALTLPAELRHRYAVIISSPSFVARHSESCEVGHNVEVTFHRSR